MSKKIGDCNSEAYSDRYAIDENMAIDVAVREGWKKGVGDWTIKRVWNTDYSACVWDMTKIEGSILKGWGGQVLTIDAISGSILGRGSWHAIP